MSSSSTSSGALSGMRAVTWLLPMLDARASRPTGLGLASRSPRSTRRSVVGWTVANVRRGVSSETYPLRACNVTLPSRGRWATITSRIRRRAGRSAAVDQLVSAGHEEFGIAERLHDQQLLGIAGHGLLGEPG